MSVFVNSLSSSALRIIAVTVDGVALGRGWAHSSTRTPCIRGLDQCWRCLWQGHVPHQAPADPGRLITAPPRASMWLREAVVHSIRIQCVDDARKQVCSVVASKQYSDVAQ